MSKGTTAASKTSGNIYIGVGGWTFPPWRGVFYPEKLAQAKELEYAASKLTSIEINWTYYGSQKPESFRKWAREVPDGFVFSLKGPRFATNRRVLAEAGDSVKRLYRLGSNGTWATVWARYFGNSHRPRNSTKRISAHSSSCCRAKHGRRAAPCSRGAPSELLRCPRSSRYCGRIQRRWFSPSTRAIPRSPISPATSSMRDCRREMTDQHLLSAEATGRLGEAARILGGRRRTGGSATR